MSCTATLDQRHERLAKPFNMGEGPKSCRRGVLPELMPQAGSQHLPLILTQTRDLVLALNLSRIPILP